MDKLSNRRVSLSKTPCAPRSGAPSIVGLFAVVMFFVPPGQNSFAKPLQDKPQPPPGAQKSKGSSDRKSPKKDAGGAKAGGKKTPAATKPLPKSTTQEAKWRTQLGGSGDSRVLYTPHFAILHNTDDEAASELSKSLESTYLACWSYAAQLGLTLKSPKCKLLVIYVDQGGPQGDILKKLGQEPLPPGQSGAYYPDLAISLFFNPQTAPDSKPPENGGKDAKAKMLAKRQSKLTGDRGLLTAQSKASTQVLWNIGYYNPLSPEANPRWLIEGTSRLFLKAERGEAKDKHILTNDPMQEYVSLSRANKLVPLRDLICGPEQFTQQGKTALVAGTESWALVLYLNSKERSSQLKQYILMLQMRPKDYKSTPQDELAAFELAFGTLDAQWEGAWREWMDRHAAAMAPRK